MATDQKVRFTTTDWASECAKAEARDVLDSANRGVIAVLNQRKPIAYIFSNGRKFRDSGKKPGAA